jgi:hypothetical protein
MTDDASAESFESELKVRGLKYSVREVGECKAFVIEDYEIPYGVNAGKKLPLAVLLPKDYPSAAPAGVHTRWIAGLKGAAGSPQTSELGGDWQRWSRIVQNWVPGRRRADLYLAQVDRWLEL